LQALQDLARRDSTDLDYAHGFEVDRRAARHVLKVAKHWAQRLGAGRSGLPGDIESAGLLLAFAYPDRIAQGANGRFRLRTGRMARFAAPQLLSDADFLIAADLGERRHESRIYLAAPISLEDLEAHFADQIEEVTIVEWDSEARLVRARRRRRLGAIVLKDGPLPDPDPDSVVRALLDGIRQEGLSILPWTKNARQLQQRLVFLHHRDPRWPNASDEALLRSLEGWLKPHLYGIRRADELQKLD